MRKALFLGEGGFISRWGTCKGLILLFGRAGLLFFVDGWVMIKSAGLDERWLVVEFAFVLMGNMQFV